jgi:N-acetyl-gamma-glutamyl-phosphate reductase
METVFVDGQEGTTGLQIRERLLAHGGVRVLDIETERRKDAGRRRELLNEADIVFLCLPDEAARESVALIDAGNTRTRVIDASTAHRVAEGWTYGLPELSPAQRTAIRGSRRVAVTGCHAAGFILALAPLVAAGIVPRDYPVACHSLTGYSGGGKKMIEQYQAAAASGAEPALTSPRPYALTLAHKHLPEMMAHTGLRHAPVFMPIVSNFYKGLAVTVPLHIRALGTTAEALHAALAARYAGERFIRVMPLRDPGTLEGGFFDVQACNDTNRVDLFVFGSDTQAVLVARLDNLGKGASGAAVQAMNVHLGVDEGLGL